MEDRRGRAARFLLQSVADAPPLSVAVHAESRFAATRSARGGGRPCGAALALTESDRADQA